MNPVKTLILAMACVLAVALLGAASASATALCNNEGVEGDCNAPDLSGTVFKGNAKGVTITTPAGTVKCGTAAIEGSLVEEPTETGKSLGAKITASSFNECVLGEVGCTPTALSLPYKASIAWTESTKGTLAYESGEGGNPGATFKCGAVTCTVTGKPTFILTGGKAGAATLAASKVELSATGTFCTGKASLTASYVFTAPAEGTVFVLADAGALRLCQKNVAPVCNLGTTYPKGTVFEAVLESETTFTVTVGGKKMDTNCNSSTFKGKTTTEEEYFLEGLLTELSFTCLQSCNVTLLSGTNLRFFATDGIGTGTMSLFAPKIKVDCTTYECTYERSLGVLVLVVTGGEPAKLSANMKWDSKVATESSTGCGSEMEWVGAYKFTLPESGGKPKLWIVRPDVSL